MSVPTFGELKNTADNTNAVRKVLEAVAFIGPQSTDLPALTDATSQLVQVPAGFIPVGLTSPDGFTFGGETNVEEVQAYGYAEPIRRDITTVTKTITFTAYETWRMALRQLITGMDLSAVTQDAASGEIHYDAPARPSDRRYAFLVIGRDGSGTSEHFLGKLYPNTSITQLPEEVWSATDPVQAPIELSAYVDDALGTACRDFYAGTGAKALADDLGWTPSV